jgi:hypothetical protein
MARELLDLPWRIQESMGSLAEIDHQDIECQPFFTNHWERTRKR